MKFPSFFIDFFIQPQYNVFRLNSLLKSTYFFICRTVFRPVFFFCIHNRKFDKNIKSLLTVDTIIQYYFFIEYVCPCDTD